MKVQTNNIWRTPLYRSATKGKPKHLRLVFLNALKQELEVGTYILWNNTSIGSMGIWSNTYMGPSFYLSLSDKLDG